MKYKWQRFDVNMDGAQDTADTIATMQGFGQGDGRLRVRCMTVRFADYSRPFSAEAAHGVFVGEGVVPTSEWLRQERGLPNDRGLDWIDFGVLYSRYTQQQIANPYPITEPFHEGLQGQGAPDYWGERRLQTMVIRDEFGLASYDGPKEWWRNAIMVLHGGGIANAPGQLGGAIPITAADYNYASCVIGDWHVFPWLTNGAAPGCAASPDPNCTKDNMLRVVGHELGHTFSQHDDKITDPATGQIVSVNGAAVWHTNYVGPEEPPGTNPHVAYGGLPLSPEQKQFIRHVVNDRWLK